MGNGLCKTNSRMKMKRSTLLLVLSLALLGCGCTSQDLLETNSSSFADTVRGYQDYYDTIVIDDPLNATAWCMRGNYYNDAFGQFGEALESYNRSLEMDPEYGYAWFSKGVTLENLQQFEEARACFEKAVQYDPSLAGTISRIRQ